MEERETGPELLRTRRCLSSGSSSLLSSPSASKASARVELTPFWRRSCDELREWNEGGGELGVRSVRRLPEGVSTSSSLLMRS